MRGKLYSRVFLCLWLLSGAVSASAAELTIDNFDSGLDSRWEVKSFKGETVYRVVAGDGGGVLQAEAHGTASGLVFKQQIDPQHYPILRWRWKVDRVLAKGDARTRDGDDYPARLYVVFPHWFFPLTKTLNYIWANRLPAGEMVPNPFTGNAMMIAVESGSSRVGEWREERRDIVADYRRAFGGEPPTIGAIAIMTDTDNTGESAMAWYDAIRLTDRQAASAAEAAASRP